MKCRSRSRPPSSSSCACHLSDATCGKKIFSFFSLWCEEEDLFSFRLEESFFFSFRLMRDSSDEVLPWLVVGEREIGSNLFLNDFGG
jgi:hypothetical protein